MGWTGRAALAAILAAAAGCASTAPPAVPEASGAPAPAPAAQEPPEGPVPILALVPGAEHLHRCRVAVTVESASETGLGPVTMDFEVEAAWHVLSSTEAGDARMECTVHRIHGSMSVPAMKFKMDIDSDDEAFRRAAAGDSSMGRSLGALIADAGTTRQWTFRKGRMPVADPSGAAEKRSFGSLAAFAWLDTLPPEPLKAGRRGERLPLEVTGQGVQDCSWEILSYDPGTGCADLSMGFSRQGSSAEEGVTDRETLDIQKGSVEVRDRFDARAGVFVSRRIHMSGGGRGAGAIFGGGGAAPVSLTMDIMVDRVESFGAVPAATK